MELALAYEFVPQPHTGAGNAAIERQVSEISWGSGATGIDEYYQAKSGEILVLKSWPEELELDTDGPSLEPASSINEEGYIARIQDEVLETFGLSMNDLALVCKVSRKTPYNWRLSEKRINQKRNGMTRLFQVLRAARDWKNSGYALPEGSLREPVLQGHSLYDFLTADQIDNDAIQFLGARLFLTQMQNFEVTDPFSQGGI